MTLTKKKKIILPRYIVRSQLKVVSEWFVNVIIIYFVTYLKVSGRNAVYGVPGQVQHLDTGHVLKYLSGHRTEPVVRQVQDLYPVHADESLVRQRAASPRK